MKIIVTGILGQDGANMVEYLLKNTEAKIFGMIRRTSNPNFVNCKSFIKNERFQLVYGDLSDSDAKQLHSIMINYNRAKFNELVRSLGGG